MYVNSQVAADLIPAVFVDGDGEGQGRMSTARHGAGIRYMSMRMNGGCPARDDGERKQS